MTETASVIVSPAKAVLGLGIWQAVWMSVFFTAIETIYDNYAVVDLNNLSAGMQAFLTYDARFISASFFLRASVCFLIAGSMDTRLKVNTLRFWSLFNLIPLALVVAYRPIFDSQVAFWTAVAIPCLEASVLAWLGWYGCVDRAEKQSLGSHQN